MMMTSRTQKRHRKTIYTLQHFKYLIQRLYMFLYCHYKPLSNSHLSKDIIILVLMFCHAVVQIVISFKAWLIELSVFYTIHFNLISFCFVLYFKGWKLKGSKCYWILKQIEHFRFHPLTLCAITSLDLMNSSDFTGFFLL